MKKRGKSLSDTDAALWEEVKKTVNPLKDRRQTPLEKPIHSVPVQETGLPASWYQGASHISPDPRIDKRTKRQISRGTRPVDRSIDLHGLTQVQAHALLVKTIHRCVQDGEKVLIVVTGKGGKRFAQTDSVSAAYRKRAEFDQFGGVLKRMVPMWLESADLRPFVQSYSSANKEHGGEGALYVLLRKKGLTT